MRSDTSSIITARAKLVDATREVLKRVPVSPSPPTLSQGERETENYCLMKVDHIGIAVNGLDEALAVWRDTLGLEVEHTEEVAEQGVRVTMLRVGESHIELLEPLTENSPVGKFLEKRGPGIHHIAVRVPDIEAALTQLKQRGTRLIDEKPRVGARGCLVAFVHPSSANGVLLELVQQR